MKPWYNSSWEGPSRFRWAGGAAGLDIGRFGAGAVGHGDLADAHAGRSLADRDRVLQELAYRDQDRIVVAMRLPAILPADVSV